MNDDLEILTIEDVMSQLMIGRNMVYRLLSQGKIKGWKLGKSWKFTQKAVDDYIRGQS